jgi:hypothetical protein
MRPFPSLGLNEFLITKGVTLPTQAMDRVAELPPEPSVPEMEAPDPEPAGEIRAKLEDVFDFGQVGADGFVQPMMPDLPFDDFA